MVSTFANYNLIARNLDRTLTLKKAEPLVARDTDYFLANIGNVKSVDDFIKDTRLFNYAMNAFGLEDMAYAKAYMRKVLNEGVAEKNSFANRLADDRFVNFAKTFDFAAKGDKVTADKEAMKKVTELYARQEVEEEAGNEDEGVRLALYFERTAPTVKSAYGLLADPALWQVVKTVLGFPDAMAGADIDKQAAAVNKRLDVKDLQDPEKLQKLIGRFTVMWDVNNNTDTDPVLALFSSGSGSAQSTVSTELAATLHNLKRGGY